MATNDHTTGPFNEKFDAIAKNALSSWHVPGVSIAVVDGDHVWSKGYGIATFPDTPVTASTLFETGSTTKAFTAAVMSLLVDDNDRYPQVQWRTPVSSLLRDDFVLEDEHATAHITIEDILSHRTGMPRHDFSYGNSNPSGKDTPRDLTRALRHLPLTEEPRTRFQYCNQMYNVASYLIETLVGKSLSDIFKERIWDPLDMQSTYLSVEEAQAGPEDVAQGYYFLNETFHPASFTNLDLISGAGSILSNVLDYAKWLKCLLGATKPISEAGHKSLKEPRIIADRTNGLETGYTGFQTYALGWQSGVYQGHQWFSHGGGMEAYGAQVIFFPDLNYGLVALGNTAETSNAVEELLLFHLIDEKLGIPTKKRFDWNKKNKIIFDKKTQNYENARLKYFPKVPSLPLPLSAKLEDYTGKYHNNGYGNISVSIKNDHLFIDRCDAFFKLWLDFEHITGDYFLVSIDSVVSPGHIFKEAHPAEFRIGADGLPKSVGIHLEPEMGDESRIWFDRV